MVYEKNAFSMPFLSGYKLLKIPILDANGVPAWPELFPTEKINQMRQIVGPRHFSSQMMLEFVPPERIRLDPGQIHFYEDSLDIHAARLGANQISGASIYWDPSSGRHKSDDSVCVLIYRDDKNHNVFIHDVMYMHVPDTETHPLNIQCQMVLDFMRRYTIRRITIETNGIGNALPEIMSDVAKHHGENIYVNKITNSRNKADRILDAIEPLLTSGHLYAHMRVRQTPLISEMLGWSPIGGVGHDDGLDALAGAISTTPIVIRPMGRAPQTFYANTQFSV